MLDLNLKEIEVDSEVSLEEIADRLEDYSGADITSLCRDAAMMSMRRMIKGKTPDEIKEMKREELEKPVTLQDFEEAIIRCQRSVGNIFENMIEIERSDQPSGCRVPKCLSDRLDAKLIQDLPCRNTPIAKDKRTRLPNILMLTAWLSFSQFYLLISETLVCSHRSKN